MTIFCWLLVGHMVGDFLLQNKWMASKKAQEWLPLLTHTFVYTCTIYLFSLNTGGLTWLGIGLIFLSHMILDRRSFVLFWARCVTQTTDIPWLLIVADQAWHILVLAAATLL